MADLTDDQKTIEKLKGDLATVTKDRDTIKGQLDAVILAKTAAEAKVTEVTTELTKTKGELTKAQGDLTKANTDLTTAETVVLDLKKQLAEKEAGSPALPTVKVGGKTYELTSDFFYNGEEVTFKSLEENKALAEELVKEGIGNLRLVAKK
ncbi:hypothetical protein IC229_05780 [Spirosoma sp. BT702]|uniref:Uncharacterized protein n=1 Tax=Spirosoma profusum TaxID=2771354 RepID=A0A926XUS4_9BACT|nr:hypothetical protein [Spirosoma profusum]MBD2700135.1 hypothetical protein [Spirosoma profusum]